MKINNCRGDLIDISAEKEALVLTKCSHEWPRHVFIKLDGSIHIFRGEQDQSLRKKWHCLQDYLHGTETNGIYEEVTLFAGLFA